MIKDFNVGTKTFTYESDRAYDPLVHMTADERIEVYCQFLTMCGDEAEMQADNMILNYTNVFSIRRNYQDDPFMGLKPKVDNPQSAFDYEPDGGWGLANKSFSENIYFGALHSYTGENDLLVNFGLKHGKKEMLRMLELGELPAVRTELFQIFWSKGTNVREWLVNDFEHNVVPEIQRRVSNLLESDQQSTTLESAYSFKKWMKENSQQKRMHYSTKDCFLDLSLRFPQAIDPESYLEPATGALKGLKLFSGEKVPNGVKQRDFVIEFAERIMDHKNYPLLHTHLQRMESQWCYAFKHIMMKTRRLVRQGRSIKELEKIS